MFKYTINYTDFDGNKRIEDLYFNLTHAELTDRQLDIEGGDIEKILTKMISEQDKAKIVRFICDIIDASYGIKSLDGKHFRKSPEILSDFKSTQAYSDFYVKVFGDPKFAAKWLEGTLPKFEDNPEDNTKTNELKNRLLSYLPDTEEINKLLESDNE